MLNLQFDNIYFYNLSQNQLEFLKNICIINMCVYHYEFLFAKIKKISFTTIPNKN
jgi:hypothetical protein